MILPYFDYADVIFMFSDYKLLDEMDRLHRRGLKLSKKYMIILKTQNCIIFQISNFIIEIK